MVNVSILGGVGLFLVAVTIDNQNVNVERNEYSLYYETMNMKLDLYASKTKFICTTFMSTFDMVFCAYIQADSAWTMLSFIPGIQICLLIVLLTLSAVLGLTTTRII